MPLKLMYITNNPIIAKIAEMNGVDWIFVDLESIGKEQRQPNMDTVKSSHTISDILKVREVISKSKLLVRINSIYEGSTEEIDQVISAGADIIMLPYFKSLDEVRFFVNYVGNRAQKCLLLETQEAVNILDDILKCNGIDYIHIGLNDLHLEMKRKFMFELLSDGTIENIANKIKNSTIHYGFGGIAQLGCGDLPAEYIIAEHYRLNSSMVILSRSFAPTNSKTHQKELEEIFSKGIKDIRSFEEKLIAKETGFFEINKMEIKKIVDKIVSKLGEKSV